MIAKAINELIISVAIAPPIFLILKINELNTIGIMDNAKHATARIIYNGIMIIIAITSGLPECNAS